MEKETEFTKLPLEIRCVHKVWKARLHGYEECIEKFGFIDNEKSPEWNKFSDLIKKFVIDNNELAQEKGLEAALVFIKNAACAGKTAKEVMNGIVNKCITASNIRIKDLAVEISLMYIEIEEHEIVQEELLKGTEAEDPKIAAACINTLTLALKEFGSKVINIELLLKKIPALLEDRNETVREEGKAMAIEIYRWIGAPLPSRFLRSQKNINTCAATESTSSDEDDDIDTDDNDDDIEPVDILSKLPKDFYEKVEEKIWQKRKKALKVLENLTKNPKLENGNYDNIVRVLKKIICKDSHVAVVIIAGKCMARLARALKKRFQPYASACLIAVLDKFREKKPRVVTVLREVADAIFLSITIDDILEDCLAALENKNPLVKAETAAFLGRCFAITPPSSLNENLLEAYTEALLKTLNDSDSIVRDRSAEALGIAMKLVGEKVMMPFLTVLNNLKMEKIRKSAEKAIILIKLTVPECTTAAASTSNANSGNANRDINTRVNKPHVRTIFLNLIKCLDDSESWIRSTAISCINTWGDQCGYKEFFYNGMISDALKSGSPELRNELWSWLAQKLPLIPVEQIPKDELMICLPYLYSNLEDCISDVRKNAQEAVHGYMIHLSYETMLKQTEKLKPDSKAVVLACLEKTRLNLFVKPLPVKKQSNESSRSCSNARNKEDDVDDAGPLLVENNLKHQRLIDEQTLEVLKWNYTTSREEFVDLLKKLMSAAGFNKTLISNMFHGDFRYHLKAIEALTNDLQDNSKALVSNLDLILEWLTLRFFDNNPSVSFKGLDYLQKLFNILIRDQYHMIENEAASFIPYLINKIGDPKDSIRNSVRALFKQIALVYPVSKLFSYIMEGLQSKNPRQRTECLEQLGSLAENYGARRYDTRTTIFSPEGRLYQVEYAMEAISHAGTCLGILANDGVLLAAERRNTNKLLDEVFFSEKIYKLNEDVVCSVAGITSDANVLTNELRLIGQRYLLQYGETIPCEQLVSWLCDVKQAYTQFGGKRPFGVSILYMGWDKHYGYQLYQSDPSGNYGGWKATCIGNNSAAAISSLKQEYKEGETTLEDAQALAIKVLSKTLDMTKLTAEKVEMATLTRENGKTITRILPAAEVTALIKEHDRLEALAEQAKKEKQKL
ncbi:hypothetical protein PV326_002969 [Microctonus aethiopoides]|nr:hypothetical protein PV326_002969 [Microctonus aethiopoides]